MPKVTGAEATSRNGFQRAQDFLRTKMNGGAKVTGSSTGTSAQQTASDAKSGGKALRAYESTRSTKGPKIPKLPSVPSFPGSGLLKNTGLVGATLTGAAMLNGVIQDEGGYLQLGKRILDTTLGVDGFDELEKDNEKYKKSINGKLYDLRNPEHKEIYESEVAKQKPPVRSTPSTETRESSEGVVQKGQTLGGVNSILEGFGAGKLADVSTAYQSEALPATLSGVTQLEKPLVEGAEPTQKPDISSPFQDNPQLQASYPEGTKPFASTDSYTPYSTGGNPENVQDGASPKPDRVERLRQVAFNGADFSGDEPDDSTLTSPTQSNPMRNQIRDIYGDSSLSIAQQSAKVSALTGVYRYGGKGYANVGGELVEASEGNNRSLLNARGGGVDPSEFLQTKVAEVKDTSKVTPTVEDTPAPSTSAVMTPGLTLEEGNAEYGAMKFVRDPKTNSMVPAK
tara:strand:+ start:736 stop:2097 length:1362 start_codon:yes stop_codon:yes gene_type:complete